MTFTRYRYLCEEWEDAPTSDDILLAVHLPKHRRNKRYVQPGVGIGPLMNILQLDRPGQTVSLNYGGL